MKPTLEQLAPCFQGLIPATLYTCSADGVPNVALLSHVDYVDARHIALSFQFFNKSRRNVLENPQARVQLVDPDTMRGWALDVRFVRSEETGPLFESMRLRIEAIASHCGLKGIFRLRAADVYEVLAIEPAVEEGPSRAHRPDTPHPAEGSAPFTPRAMQAFVERVSRARGLEALLDAALEGLEASFGFAHSMILLAGERPGRLVAIAGRGYPGGGIGAEVAVGEGLIGMVAESRRPTRISGLLREMLYAEAMAEATASAEPCEVARRGVPLPGLPQPESQLGIPLVVRDELLGVLFAESETPRRFHEEDRAFCEVLGAYLGLALRDALRDMPRAALPETPRAATNGHPGGGGGAGPEIHYHAADECLLVDREYLIRGLAARLLWRMLCAWRDEGRREFTNREFRLDKSLQLPDFKDNLETRLLLLRRRLEQRCPEIRLVRRGRGSWGSSWTGPRF